MHEVEYKCSSNPVASEYAHAKPQRRSDFSDKGNRIPVGEDRACHLVVEHSENRG
jgi:hypothetical protein